MRSTTRRVPVVLAVTAALTVTACSGEDVAEGFLERAIEAESGEDIDIDIDGDTVRIESADGEVQMTTDDDGNVSVEGVTDDGETVTILGGGGLGDVNWPDSVPIPDGITVDSVIEQDYGDGPNFALLGTAPGNSVEVADRFAAGIEANGYTESQRSSDASGYIVLGYDSAERSVVASFNPFDDSTTYVQIGISPAKP